MFACTYACTHTKHMYIHRYTYMHIYTCMCVLLKMLAYWYQRRQAIDLCIKEKGDLKEFFNKWYTNFKKSLFQKKIILESLKLLALGSFHNLYIIYKTNPKKRLKEPSFISLKIPFFYYKEGNSFINIIIEESFLNAN